jgi:CPA1 family monovalent cation:H+ antiporter
LSIALALSVPATMGQMQTGRWIFAATYMVVVFSIIVQGGSLQFALARKYRKPAAVHSS